ncbi:MULTISPECIES: hypothetical protein [unclassified Nocardioides]|uniref:hypothetical protein n=1 Tax=unclassified Nocardioides TaxID=2615069 RepID=UPI0007030D0B|nr:MULTISPECIES: hypothetical protein [unclassified Nocardioides]KQZ70255.1 hypothetical protein ASD66_11450 [Nocardioides sp. Root151]KRF16352.1 hypothetical protein ASH02_07200 [Nocardioides sp. Soil796]
MKTRILAVLATAFATVVAPAIPAVAHQAPAAAVVRAPYLDGGTLHVNGQALSIDWGTEPPAADASIGGRGRTSDGRLAVVSREYLDDDGSGDICYRQTMWFIDTAGTAARASGQVTCLYDDDGWAVDLSDSGDTYYESYTDMWGSQVTVTVKRLDGTRLAQRSFPIGVDVLDVDGNRAVIGGLGGWGFPPKLYVWTFGSGVRTVVSGTVDGADLKGRVQWRKVKDGYTTARDLMNPKAVLWKLRFQPVEVSPDGQRVLGLATNSKGVSTGVIQVRRLRTGAVIRSLKPATPWTAGRMDWDGNGAIFGPRDTAAGSYLVRCPLASSCVRAQDIESSAGFVVFRD